MNKKLKTVPKFRSEAEERTFWESHDTADYFDLSKAQRARFPESEALHHSYFAAPAAGPA